MRTGRTLAINAAGQCVQAAKRVRVLSRPKVSHLNLAHAGTVHKAQGWAFDAVKTPIVAHLLLDRTMIHTALTKTQGKPSCKTAKPSIMPPSSHRPLEEAVRLWHGVWTKNPKPSTPLGSPPAWRLRCLSRYGHHNASQLRSRQAQSAWIPHRMKTKFNQQVSI